MFFNASRDQMLSDQYITRYAKVTPFDLGVKRSGVKVQTNLDTSQ